jgi:predicted signal transduction protein with EAL and GGDEF domain
MTASIGITMLDVSDASMRETLRRADEALYQAKRNGRDQYVVRFTTHPVGGTESSPAPQGGTASGDE